MNINISRNKSPLIHSLFFALLGALITLLLSGLLNANDASADVPTSGGGDGYPSDSSVGTSAGTSGGDGCDACDGVGCDGG